MLNILKLSQSTIGKFSLALLPPRHNSCATLLPPKQVKSAYSTVNMLYSADYLKEKLTKLLDATHVEVIDESNCGCGMKFSCIIVSDKFKGKPTLQRHRLVNASLQEELKEIHAFSQQTFDVDQWKKQLEKSES